MNAKMKMSMISRIKLSLCMALVSLFMSACSDHDDGFVTYSQKILHFYIEIVDSDGNDLLERAVNDGCVDGMESIRKDGVIYRNLMSREEAFAVVKERTDNDYPPFVTSYENFPTSNNVIYIGEYLGVKEWKDESVAIKWNDGSCDVICWSYSPDTEIMSVSLNGQTLKNDGVIVIRIER